MYHDRIHVEVLKLLVQIAWADHEVQVEEADYVLDLARQVGVDDRELESLRRALIDDAQLLAPNLRILRTCKQDALRAVDQLIAIDDRIVADELAARAAVEKLLDRA